METKAATFVIKAEALIAQPGWDAIGPEQGRQKMAFRVAEAAALQQNLRRSARDCSELIVAGMLNVVSNPFKAATSNGNRVREVPAQNLSLGNDRGMLPIDYLSRS